MWFLWLSLTHFCCSSIACTACRHCHERVCGIGPWIYIYQHQICSGISYTKKESAPQSSNIVSHIYSHINIQWHYSLRNCRLFSVPMYALNVRVWRMDTTQRPYAHISCSAVECPFVLLSSNWTLYLPLVWLIVGLPKPPPSAVHDNSPIPVCACVAVSVSRLHWQWQRYSTIRQ